MYKNGCNHELSLITANHCVVLALPMLPKSEQAAANSKV